MYVAPHRLMGSDPEAIKGATIRSGVFRRVLHLARPYRRQLVAFVTVIIASALIALIPPLLFRQIIDKAIPNHDERLLNLLALAVIAAALADAVLSFVERWLSATIGEGLIFDLRVALFDHVQRMPITFFTRTQTGALISRLNNDVIGAQRAMTSTLGSVVSNIVILITTLTAMFLLEWRLTLLSLALLPLFIVPAKRVGRKLQAITREGMDLNSSMNTRMTERFGVSGALLVKLFGQHDLETNEFAQRAGRVRDIGVRNAVFGRTFFISLTLVGAIGTAAVYWIGGKLVISDVITIGTLVAMTAFVTRIYAPLTSLTNARVDIMTAFVSFDRVFEVLDTPNPITERDNAVDLENARGAIEFTDVRFRYPAPAQVSIASLENQSLENASLENASLGEEVAAPTPAEATDLVLHGITASIEPGQLIALVGPSGAGKTTLTSLIPRLHDVSSGAVRIDGIDVRDLTLTSLRSAIGVVSQDPHLFHESVLDNLRFAKPTATRAEIEQACVAAQIHEVITALPAGYDTVVGERGYRLSGGEKQRLAIARMLLKDPAIVILDEATSHLDSENEVLVQEALAHVLAKRTSIVIAHRLSTITAADQILVLDNGSVVERGTHAELINNGGLYHDLYSILIGAGEAVNQSGLRNNRGGVR